MNPEQPSAGPPARLGPYRLDQRLGSGGMGEVWRAWDERLERWVAFKQVRADKALRHGRERLRREARAVARLNHPAIVHVYDFEEGRGSEAQPALAAAYQAFREGFLTRDLIEARELLDRLS